MNEALGFLNHEERYTVIPFLKNIEKTFPDFIEWAQILDLGKKVQLLKMISRDKEMFIKDTMWGLTEYVAFRDTHAQKVRRIAQEEKPREKKEELLVINKALAKKFGFNLNELKTIT